MRLERRANSTSISSGVCSWKLPCTKIESSAAFWFFYLNLGVPWGLLNLRIGKVLAPGLFPDTSGALVEAHKLS